MPGGAFGHLATAQLLINPGVVSGPTPSHDQDLLSFPDNSPGVPAMESSIAGPTADPLPANAAQENTHERPVEPWAAEVHKPPLSRMSIGADISPMGVGLKSAILLSRYFDARALGNYFSFDTGRFELEGFNVDGNLHLASAGAALDWYPMNSVWRLSVGTLFYNGNQISMSSRIVQGTSFSLNQTTFYADTPNAATGVTPLAGSGVLGFHTHQPALTLSFGFGRFIPRSNRHWSFPAEFGVAFTGAPSISTNTSGWVCTDKAQTRCSNLADKSNPVTIEFNNALQAQLNRWRQTASNYPIYPIFSYSVVYSFNIR